MTRNETRSAKRYVVYNMFHFCFCVSVFPFFFYHKQLWEDQSKSWCEIHKSLREVFYTLPLRPSENLVWEPQLRGTRHPYLPPPSPSEFRLLFSSLFQLNNQGKRKLSPSAPALWYNEWGKPPAALLAANDLLPSPCLTLLWWWKTALPRAEQA